MTEQEYLNAFTQNEKEANRYTAKCLRVLAVIVAIVWLLNIVGIFTVPMEVMTIAAPLSMAIFGTPTILLRFFKKKPYQMKYFIMLCCVLGITVLSGALPKHSIVAWAAPIILACHYYSKRLSWGTLAATTVCLLASLEFATYYGEWDPYLLRSLPYEGERRITREMLSMSIQYYGLPRCMILAGLNFTCATLATRTRKLLELQVKESAEKHRIESELNVATQIQTSMLPNAFPEREEIDLFASMSPAREVGGDFYDFFMVDDRHLAIVMADVSGKGVPAALFMVFG